MHREVKSILSQAYMLTMHVCEYNVHTLQSVGVLRMFLYLHMFGLCYGNIVTVVHVPDRAVLSLSNGFDQLCTLH